MALPAPVAALRAVRNLIVDQGGTEILAVAAAIDLWLAQGGDFACALGLAPGWHSALRQRQREEILRELVRTFPGLRGRPMARAIADAASDYETRRWARDRAARRRPDDRDGWLYDLLVMGPIPAEATLRKCIGYS